MMWPLVVSCLACVSAALVTALTLPLWRRWCWHTGQMDEPGPRKIHDRPVPLAGGPAVLTGLLAPLLVGAGLLVLAGAEPRGQPVGKPLAETDTAAVRPQPAGVALLAHGLSRRGLPLAAILAGAVAMTALGAWDDRRDLRPLIKFAGQVLIAALTTAAGVRVTLFVPSPVFSYAITILWIVTVTNAFNFMDNMNGLCAGLGAIAAWCIGLCALAQVHYLVAPLAFLVCGALLGFLPFNFPRATAFLGDAGSHLTGYLMAVLTIVPHFYSPLNPRPWAVLSPLLLLAVPLADLARVVGWRWRQGRPVYVGDTNHLSHQLARRGLSQTLAVLLLWLAGAVTGALAVCCA